LVFDWAPALTYSLNRDSLQPSQAPKRKNSWVTLNRSTIIGFIGYNAYMTSATALHQLFDSVGNCLSLEAASELRELRVTAQYASMRAGFGSDSWPSSQHASADYSQPDALARDQQQNPSLTQRVTKNSLLFARSFAALTYNEKSIANEYPH